MVRTVIIPDDIHIELDIPKEYVGKTIEITYMAVDEIQKFSSTQKTMGDFWGVLSDKSAEALRTEIEESRNEWDRGI